jgi:hypothetical protein
LSRRALLPQRDDDRRNWMPVSAPVMVRLFIWGLLSNEWFKGNASRKRPASGHRREILS